MMRRCTCLRFYRCYRAAVRGKVESITTREPEIGPDQALEARERAGRYFALAQRYATDAPRQALIIVGGLSGTGKSHLASALAARIGAVLVRSDAVRKEMLHAPDGRSAPLSYDREARARVYEAARERVRTHLEAGRAVVFDATHLELRQRDAARALAVAITGAGFADLGRRARGRREGAAGSSRYLSRSHLGRPVGDVSRSAGPNGRADGVRTARLRRTRRLGIGDHQPRTRPRPSVTHLR